MLVDGVEVRRKLEWDANIHSYSSTSAIEAARTGKKENFLL